MSLGGWIFAAFSRNGKPWTGELRFRKGFYFPSKVFRSPSIQASRFLSLQELFGHPPRDDRRIASGPVVDDDAGFDTLLNRLPHEIGRLPHHLRLQHPHHEFVKGMGLGVGDFIPHSDRGHESDDSLSSGVENPLIRFRQLFSQGRKPGPVGEHLPYPVLFQQSEDPRAQVGIGSKLDMVRAVPGDGFKETVQILRYLL
jgi:hypothetical protein